MYTNCIQVHVLYLNNKCYNVHLQIVMLNELVQWFPLSWFAFDIDSAVVHAQICYVLWKICYKIGDEVDCFRCIICAPSCN